MRLNIRLMGLLFGILLLAIVGRGLLYSGARGGRGGRGGGGGAARSRSSGWRWCWSATSASSSAG
jgi:hypothetical protein